VSIVVAALSALLAVGGFLSGGADGFLGMLPAVLFALVLACGRYPGERVIVRLAQRSRQRRLKIPSASVPNWLRTPCIPDRIVLLAASRPLRAPPLHSV
jgi:hypothetical protein